MLLRVSEQLCALEAPIRVAKSLETSLKNMPGNEEGIIWSLRSELVFGISAVRL